MERFLTHEEENYVIAALQFYAEFGPAETVVANYSGSFPNDPAQAVRKMAVDDIPSVIGIIKGWPRGSKAAKPSDQPEADYLKAIETFIGPQAGDLWDYTALIAALNRYSQKLARKVREILTDIDAKEA